MKKMFAPLFLLVLLLGLTACGGTRYAEGRVVEVCPQADGSNALIVEKEGGGRAAVILDAGTQVISFLDGFDASGFAAAPHTDVSVSFPLERRAGTVTAADGKTVKAYRTEPHPAEITAYRMDDAALADGTAVECWTNRFGTAYTLADGTKLLHEQRPIGPENLYVDGQEGFQDLSAAARPAVAQYYAEQGLLYDVSAELERAWSALQNDPKGFSSFYLSQETYPVASSAQVMYFTTTVTRTMSGSIVQPEDRCCAFDRGTGECLPLSALITCPEDELRARIFDLAERSGGAPTEEPLHQEMLDSLDTAPLTLSVYGLDLTFPAGTLHEADGSLTDSTWSVSAEWQNGADALFQPWAVPDFPIEATQE